jgi:hypothetical protein
MVEIAKNTLTIAEKMNLLTTNVISIGKVLGQRRNQEFLEYEFTNVYRQLNKMNIRIEANKDLELYLRCLETELVMSQRRDIIEVILNKLEDINPEVRNVLFKNIEELKTF